MPSIYPPLARFSSFKAQEEEDPPSIASQNIVFERTLTYWKMFHTTKLFSSTNQTKFIKRGNSTEIATEVLKNYRQSLSVHIA